MAEGQMGSTKGKGVLSDDITNLSDNEYQNLLDEALNIKSMSLHNKSPMMQNLLKEVAIDDDDFPSNVREMVDAVKEGNSAVGGCAASGNKKLRSADRRRAKDDQQRLMSSAAARSSQGGSLQNLSGCGTRKMDGAMVGGWDARGGRNRLQKSGSISSIISEVEGRLDLLTSQVPWMGSSGKANRRALRSQVGSGSVESVVPSMGEGDGGALTMTRPSSTDAATGKHSGSRKCNYSSLSFDGSVPAARTRCLQKQIRRKSTPSCAGDGVVISGNGRSEQAVAAALCLGSAVSNEQNGSDRDHDDEQVSVDANRSARWSLQPHESQGEEMMEIDHSDDDGVPKETTPLIRPLSGGCGSANSRLGGRWSGATTGATVIGVNDSNEVVTCHEETVEVDKCIAMPLHQNDFARNEESNDDYAKRGRNPNYVDSRQTNDCVTVHSTLDQNKADVISIHKDVVYDGVVRTWGSSGGSIGSTTVSSDKQHILNQQSKKKKKTEVPSTTTTTTTNGFPVSTSLDTYRMDYVVAGDVKFGVRSQLDVNGNPMDDLHRNYAAHQTAVQRSSTRRDIQDQVDANRLSSADVENRRKHKRAKANSTLKEMKAGEIQGNRGNDPLDSLVEFINSSDKKTSKSARNGTGATLATAISNVGTKNNKVQNNVKAKKQEKENNKRNLPGVRLVNSSSNATTLMIGGNGNAGNAGMATVDDDEEDEGVIYDLIMEKFVRPVTTRIHESVPAVGMAVSATTAVLDEHVNGTIKAQPAVVRKAHSWEGSSVPVDIVKKSLSVDGCDVLEVGCCDGGGGMMTVPGNASEPSVISSFVSDFYAVSDVSQVVEDSEFHVVLPKKHRRNHNNRSSLARGSSGGDGGYYSSGSSSARNGHFRNSGGDFDLNSTNSGEERDAFSKFRWNCSHPEDMMLLAGLPIAHHRGQRGPVDSRRKSTSSMPPSDHSSVDNSDLDSVHSLPVKSTTVKPTIAKTSSSSSNTPQASYADIAKMATTPSVTPPFSSSSASSVHRIRVAVPSPVVQEGVLLAEMVSTPREVLPVSLPSPRTFPLVRSGNKRDASTSTTDDIPTTRTTPPMQITHWASYPTLAEATGKNDPTPGSGGTLVTNKGDEHSGTQSGDSKSGGTGASGNDGSLSSSPESVEMSRNTTQLQDQPSDQRLPEGSGGGEIVLPSSHCMGDQTPSPPPANRPKKDDKTAVEQAANEKPKDGQAVRSPTVPNATTAVGATGGSGNMPAVVPNFAPKRRKDAPQSSQVLTQTANVDLASPPPLPPVDVVGPPTEGNKTIVRTVRRLPPISTITASTVTTISGKSVPAVVIMNNYRPGPCEVDVTFGFEVNEQLMQMTGLAMMSSSDNSSSLSSPPSASANDALPSPPPTSMVAVTANRATSGGSASSLPSRQGQWHSSPVDRLDVSGDPSTLSAFSSSAGSGVVDRSSADASPASSSPELVVHKGSCDMREEDTTNFNYSNIVDYIGQSWDVIVRELEKEKVSATETRHVKYHNND